jgi:hypothetical protein
MNSEKYFAIQIVADNSDMLEQHNLSFVNPTEERLKQIWDLCGVVLTRRTDAVDDIYIQIKSHNKSDEKHKYITAHIRIGMSPDPANSASHSKINCTSDMQTRITEYGKDARTDKWHNESDFDLSRIGAFKEHVTNKIRNAVEQMETI